ncbi:hypothetical protein Ahy_A06g027340 isoform D [Arachis hypogaea]|uniref:Uncharacterized protein n=1 Tax=Arachis hypogaea TaxID=3818 RepID=A0A445CNF4_ARAHY|nr:hypothetical protein Ahy_A06g027340 isoform D [Arachis hypogaea]
MATRLPDPHPLRADPIQWLNNGSDLGSDPSPFYTPRRTVAVSYNRSKLLRCHSFYRSPSSTAAKDANRRRPPHDATTRIKGDHRLTRIGDTCTPGRCESQLLSANLGGKISGKSSFRNRARSKEGGSDDSDEDYVVSDEDEEVSDCPDEYSSSLDGCATEESYDAFIDEEEEDDGIQQVKKFNRSEAGNGVCGRQKNANERGEGLHMQNMKIKKHKKNKNKNKNKNK